MSNPLLALPRPLYSESMVTFQANPGTTPVLLFTAPESGIVQMVSFTNAEAGPGGSVGTFSIQQAGAAVPSPFYHVTLAAATSGILFQPFGVLAKGDKLLVSGPAGLNLSAFVTVGRGFREGTPQKGKKMSPFMYPVVGPFTSETPVATFDKEFVIMKMTLTGVGGTIIPRVRVRLDGKDLVQFPTFGSPAVAFNSNPIGQTTPVAVARPGQVLTVERMVGDTSTFFWLAGVKLTD